MKKITVLLFAMMACVCALQLDAAPAKGPARSNAYSSLPDGYQQLPPTSIYYNISRRFAAGPGYQYGVSILGKIGDEYYSSTYEYEEEPSIWNWWNPTPKPGAGFIAALQVDNGTPTYVNALNGTNVGDVRMTTRLEPQGNVAARVIYTVTNNGSVPVTINAGVWADIMIGTNDEAPLEMLTTSSDATYGIKMKRSIDAGSPLLCVLFGEHVTGVTPVDDYWFGFYSTNWHANEIVGEYSSTVYDAPAENGGTFENSPSDSQYYGKENLGYDSGLGFCWKGKEIPAGESIELSYLISVGEIDFEEPDPDPEPGQDILTAQVEAYNFEGWNDLTVAHPAHVWGYYEHPYGQEGFIEYMVDGDRGEWTRIETPLVSGQTYELPFDMFFNPDVTDIHTLQLRFNDGLDNIREMDGLEWEDVRSMSLTVAPETQVYDGTPKTFTVTVGGVIDYVVGGDGEYVNPGTYSQSIWGDYDMNTIGINTVEFEIVKGQAEVEVDYESPVKHDGNGHGATVVVVVGDAQAEVTYTDMDGNVINGLPTEIGSYLIVVNVPDTEFYNGIVDEIYGPIVIYADPTGINEVTVGNDNGAWYTIDGRRVAAPTERGIYIHNGKKYIFK